MTKLDRKLRCFDCGSDLILNLENTKQPKCAVCGYSVWEILRQFDEWELTIRKAIKQARAVESERVAP